MSGTGEAQTFAVTLQFSDDLAFFLPRRNASQTVTRHLREKTSVKDVIESCGVPHTEVDAVNVNGVAVDFAHQLEAHAEVFVLGTGDESKIETRLQRRHISRFVADGHLGKLTRDLRLLGFDVAYSSQADDHSLVGTATGEQRALLTRDRRLLMHRAVQDGYCLRSTDPDAQIAEVLRRFKIDNVTSPFTRCIACNGLLAPVRKDEVLAQLEPLTKMYYHDFRRCTDCGKIYWSGSHFEKLQARLAKLRPGLMRATP